MNIEMMSIKLTINLTNLESPHCFDRTVVLVLLNYKKKYLKKICYLCIREVYLIYLGPNRFQHNMSFYTYF